MLINALLFIIFRSGWFPKDIVRISPRALFICFRTMQNPARLSTNEGEIRFFWCWHLYNKKKSLLLSFPFYVAFVCCFIIIFHVLLLSFSLVLFLNLCAIFIVLTCALLLSSLSCHYHTLFSSFSFLLYCRLFHFHLYTFHSSFQSFHTLCITKQAIIYTLWKYNKTVAYTYIHVYI